MPNGHDYGQIGLRTISWASMEAGFNQAATWLVQMDALTNSIKIAVAALVIAMLYGGFRLIRELVS